MNIHSVEYLSSIKVTGWLDKGWYHINNDGVKYLVKGNSKAQWKNVWSKGYEPYSEVMASNIAEFLGITHIPYTLAEAKHFPEIKTNGIDHVSICPSYIKDGYRTQNLYKWATQNGYVYKKGNVVEILDFCKEKSIDLTMLYRIILFDALVGNIDRHLRNIELFVPIDLSKPPHFVPLFDNGGCLLAAVPNTDLIASGIPYVIDYAKPFYRTHRKQIKLVPREFYQYIDRQTLLNGLLACVAPMKPYLPSFRYSAICSYLTWRVRYLEQVMGGGK